MCVLVDVCGRRESALWATTVRDDQLFDQYWPVEGRVVTEIAESRVGSACKRNVASVFTAEVLPRIPLKSRIPALASLTEITEPEGGSRTKKCSLMTREKLRASFNDPKGLLDLMDSSTNSLKRTKKMELLKSTCYNFITQKNASFSDKLNAVILRLDLGMGGQSVADSLILFGANALTSLFICKECFGCIE